MATKKAAASKTELAAAETEARGIEALVISTPGNPAYEGTTYGVKFTEGRADVTQHAAPNRWGYSLTQLADLFSRAVDGYQVEIIYADGEREMRPAALLSRAGAGADLRPKPVKATA